jgi:CDP-2,3-bis-(O-geranylgeranyl)-sn-glycerol synthase
MYLLLPGLVANMAPVFFKKVNFLNYPLDFNKKWRGKPLLGNHKTFRGFFFGILLAILIVLLQKFLFTNIVFFKNISLINYSEENFVLIGFILGFGALFGDAVKSFFKRRTSIKPGSSWIPWDQLDFIIGELVFLCLIFIPPLAPTLIILLVVPLLHILFNHLGFYLGLSKTKF